MKAAVTQGDVMTSFPLVRNQAVRSGQLRGNHCVGNALQETTNALGELGWKLDGLAEIYVQTLAKACLAASCEELLLSLGSTSVLPYRRQGPDTPFRGDSRKSANSVPPPKIPPGPRHLRQDARKEASLFLAGNGFSCCNTRGGSLDSLV
jgi:hypothetical protein